MSNVLRGASSLGQLQTKQQLYSSLEIDKKGRPPTALIYHGEFSIIVLKHSIRGSVKSASLAQKMRQSQ